MDTTLKVFILTEQTKQYSEDERVVIAESLEQALELAGISEDEYLADKWAVQERPVAPGMVAQWVY